jgi:hypothetical protein
MERQWNQHIRLCHHHFVRFGILDSGYFAYRKVCRSLGAQHPHSGCMVLLFGSCPGSCLVSLDRLSLNLGLWYQLHHQQLMHLKEVPQRRQVSFQASCFCIFLFNFD